MKHCCNKAADNEDEMSNLSDSNECKDEEARTCCSLRTLTPVTTGAMTMTVEVAVANVVDVAISQQGTEERGRWETHNNQLKLNDHNAFTRTTSTINNEHDDNNSHNFCTIVIGQVPA